MTRISTPLFEDISPLLVVKVLEVYWRIWSTTSSAPSAVIRSPDRRRLTVGGVRCFGLAGSAEEHFSRSLQPRSPVVHFASPAGIPLRHRKPSNGPPRPARTAQVTHQPLLNRPVQRNRARPQLKPPRPRQAVSVSPTGLYSVMSTAS